MSDLVMHVAGARPNFPKAAPVIRTERPVTITHGTNRLVTKERLPQEIEECLHTGRAETWPIPPQWDGRSGERIAKSHRQIHRAKTGKC